MVWFHGGDYLFEDLIASLKWIQTNIAAFGGDANNVTVFGESGGGGKTDAMVARLWPRACSSMRSWRAARTAKASASGPSSP